MTISGFILFVLSFKAGGADFQAFAVDLRPLQIRVFAIPINDVVMATQKFALVGHHWFFAAKRTPGHVQTFIYTVSSKWYFCNMIFSLFLYLVVIISAVFHEFMHGWVAYNLGDPTAKNMGRLTLNPLKHIDPIGTVLLPLFLITLTNGGFIGWAKPVPYNPNNLTDRKFGSTKVAFAGPAANFFIALIFGLIIRFLPLNPVLFVTFGWITYINLILGFFNLIPVPPLDGSKLVMDLYPKASLFLMRFSVFGIFFALMIAFIILAPLAGLFFRLIVGQPFIPVRLF